MLESTGECHSQSCVSTPVPTEVGNIPVAVCSTHDGIEPNFIRESRNLSGGTQIWLLYLLVYLLKGRVGGPNIFIKCFCNCRRKPFNESFQVSISFRTCLYKLFDKLGICCW